MLSCLSSRPRPFSTLIPSKDHRRAYLDILVWLLRHGWVTQLRTFGLLKIPKVIKQKVAKERVLLEQQRQQQQATDGVEQNISPAQATNLHVTPIHSDHSNRNIVVAGNVSVSMSLSGNTASTNPGSGKQSLSITPVSSATQHTGSHPFSSATQSSLSVGTAASSQQSPIVIESSFDDLEDSFILEPQQASSLESAWMEMITRDQPADVTAIFDRYVVHVFLAH